MNATMLQFTDGYGAVVNIASGEVRAYAGVRAEQLKALTKIMAEAAVGGGEVDKSDFDVLLLWASELANALHELVYLIHEDALNENSGGAS
jgi:hypothetical protein